MRRVCSVIALALIASTAVLAEQPAAAEEEVRNTIQAFTASYKAELPKYFTYFDPNAIMWWSSRGRVTVQDYQNLTKTRKDYELTKADDLRVQVSPSGDAAIASYLLTTKNPGEAGVEFQMTAALFRQGGAWKIVNLHVSRPQPRRQASE